MALLYEDMMWFTYFGVLYFCIFFGCTAGLTETFNLIYSGIYKIYITICREL
jgi:hypothetical protein